MWFMMSEMKSLGGVTLLRTVSPSWNTYLLPMVKAGALRPVCRNAAWPRSRILSTLAMRHSRSEEHTSELQSLMRTSYAVFYLNKKTQHIPTHHQHHQSTTTTQHTRSHPTLH